MKKILIYIHDWLLARDLKDSRAEISQKNEKP